MYVNVCHCNNTVCDCAEYNQTYTLSCSADTEPHNLLMSPTRKHRRKGQRRAHNGWNQ